MIETGQGPLVIAAGVGVDSFQSGGGEYNTRYELEVQNVGNMTALNVSADLDFQGIAQVGGETSGVAALVPGSRPSKVIIDVKHAVMQGLVGAFKQSGTMWCRIRIGFTTQDGLVFSDVSQIECQLTHHFVTFRGLPKYVSKISRRVDDVLSVWMI